jgi:hypothetical protein
MAKIVGSDIAHAVPLTLIAGTGHRMMGSVDWQIMGSLLAGSLPGRHFCRQLFRYTHPRARPQAGTGDHAVCGREPHRLRPRDSGFVDLHRVLGAGRAISS